MVKVFIKGRNYFINNQPAKIKKTKIKKRIAPIKRRIQRKINRSYYTIKRGNKRRNFSSKSYFRRYLLAKRKRLFRRTKIKLVNLKKYYHEESQIFYKLRKDIKREEYKLKLKQRWFYKSKYRRLSKRRFSFGKVYFTHRRRNTFITIYHVFTHHDRTTQRVIFKTTAGLIGYSGPKRRTQHARQAVIKTGGSFLARYRFTSIDLIMTSGINRTFYYLIRCLFQAPIYVRHIIISKRRSHGFTRLKKAKRL